MGYTWYFPPRMDICKIETNKMWRSITIIRTIRKHRQYFDVVIIVHIFLDFECAFTLFIQVPHSYATRDLDSKETIFAVIRKFRYKIRLSSRKIRFAAFDNFTSVRLFPPSSYVFRTFARHTSNGRVQRRRTATENENGPTRRRTTPP